MTLFSSNTEENAKLSLLFNNDWLPEKTQFSLAKDQSLVVRKALAAHRSLAEEVQASLFNNQNPDICEALASNHSLTPKLQALLLTSEDLKVVTALASNQALIPEVQRILFNRVKTGAHQSTLDIRLSLVGNPALLPALQLRLINDEVFRVRVVLAGNHSLIPEAQKGLLQEALTSNQQFVGNLKTNLASNPALMLELQTVLAKSEYFSIIFTLTTNPALKIKPAAIIYFNKNPKAKLALRESNIKLWNKIEKLECEALKERGIEFVRLGNKAVQEEIVKEWVLKSLDGESQGIG